VEKLGQLRVLFLSNNKIKDWTEIDRLAAAERLEDLLLVGNPLYNDYKDNNTLAEYRVEVGMRRQFSSMLQQYCKQASLVFAAACCAVKGLACPLQHGSLQHGCCSS